MSNRRMCDDVLMEFPFFPQTVDELTNIDASHFASRTLQLERGLYVIRERKQYSEEGRD